jgi:CheY-like chemotaxis protein
MESNKVINILLVEDDSLDVIDMQRTLTKMNILHKTAVAKNGEEAIEYLESPEAAENKPDLVLLDINMPKMNGIEFLTAIRKKEQWRDLKVFMVTTSDERIDREAAKKLGVSGYIVKPLKLNNPSSIDSFNLMIDLMNMKSGY